MAQFVFVSLMEGVPWGGSEELWSQAALRLKEAGHSVAVSVKRWETPPRPKVDALSAAGIQVHQREDSTPTVSRRKRVLRRLGLAKGEPEKPHPFAIPGIPPADFAVLSSGSNIAHPWCVDPYLNGGVPYALICQMATDTWWPSDDERKLYAQSFVGAAAVFYVSHANQRLTENQLCHRHPSSHVVCNPFPKTVWDGVPWPAKSETLKLAFVGRLDPAAKGCDILLQVMARPEWKARPVEVSMFGSGVCEEGTRALSEMLGCTNVVFRGFENDVAKIWREHHALVLPSRFEGLPIAIMEAMLAGRVCIVSDVAGNAELMQDNDSGFVASGANVTAFAEAMERAWAARDRWSEIGARAHTAAVSQLPNDPVGVFVQHLERLAKAGKPTA